MMLTLAILEGVELVDGIGEAELPNQLLDFQ